MSVIRAAKIFLVGSVGLFGLLTGIDNVVDYRTNLEAVRHVLSMDTLPAESVLQWRAITNTTLHNLAYWAIIVVELLYGGLCLLGAVRLFGARDAASDGFNSAKGLAVAGITIGFALYFVGFLVIGGEWFQMWQAERWNMQGPAFRFLGSIGLVLIFLCLPEMDP